MKSDPEHKKKNHGSKYPKRKQSDADKSSVRKKRSRSHELSLRGLRERRRTHTPDKKRNKSPPSPSRKPAPRKFLVDPEPLKRPLAPTVVLSLVAIKEKKKKSKPSKNGRGVFQEKSAPGVSQSKNFKKKKKSKLVINNKPVAKGKYSSNVIQPNYERNAWGIKRHKRKELQLPKQSTKSIKFWSRSKSKTSFGNYPVQTYSERLDASENHSNFAKRFLRKQVWAVSKPYIKRNPRLTKLLEDSKIDIDKIKINKLDLDVINIDALGIKNKALKKSVIWLMK